MVCRTRLYFRGGTALAVSVPSKLQTKIAHTQAFGRFFRFFVLLSRLATKKAARSPLLPFICPFRGVLFRLTSSFAGQWYCPLLRPFPRDFILLSYFISCPVRVYSFSPRRMKIWPLRRSFLASPALTGTFSRDSPNAS